MARRIVAVLACLLVTFLAPDLPEPASAQEDSGVEKADQTSATRPNIIYILTDDLDSASVQRMPTIRSQLVERGTSFENDFVSYPLCCPSRSTILTGLYAHNHGVKGNGPPAGGFEKFRSEGHEENTIAARLQESGYRTALFGKYLNGYPGGEPSSYVPPGWDEWYGKLNGQTLYDYGINQNGEVVSYGNDAEDFYTDVLSGQATDFVRRTASDPKPFFMYVAPTAPHGPATPAKRYRDAFGGEEAPRPPSFDEEDVSDKPSRVSNTASLSEKQVSGIDRRYQKRLGSMLAVDDMVASLLGELEATGKLENTFVFFTSDNGFEQGEHRIIEGKNRPYEESARVPLFVRGPGVTAGARLDKLTLNTDFAPTFADLAGVKFSADGRSLAPLFLRGEDPQPWRSAVLLEGFGEARKQGQPRGYGAVRTQTKKYVEYDNGEKELYDLSSDPYELQNILESADPSLVADLKARLDALENCSGEGGCRQAEEPAPTPVPPSVTLPSSVGSALADPAQGQPYLVRPGDTLSEIAERFGASVATIARVNGVQDPDVIFAGQTLYVPVGPAP